MQLARTSFPTDVYRLTVVRFTKMEKNRALPGDFLMAPISGFAGRSRRRVNRELSTPVISMHAPWCGREYLHPMGCCFMPVDPPKDERMTGQFYCSLNCNLNSAHTTSTTKEAVSTYMVVENMH